jgi:hypothetical protein
MQQRRALDFVLNLMVAIFGLFFLFDFISQVFASLSYVIIIFAMDLTSKLYFYYSLLLPITKLVYSLICFFLHKRLLSL